MSIFVCEHNSGGDREGGRQSKPRSNEVVFLWNRTLVAFVDKLSSTTADFIRSEGELKNCALYGLYSPYIYLQLHTL